MVDDEESDWLDDAMPVVVQVIVYSVCAFIAFALGGVIQFSSSSEPELGYSSILGVTAFAALFFGIGAGNKRSWWIWLLVYVALWAVVTVGVFWRFNATLTG